MSAICSHYMLLQHWLRYILLALAIRTATGTRHSSSSSYNSNCQSNSNNVAAYKLSTAKQGLGLGKHAARSACWLKQMLNVWNCNKLACDMWQYPWQTHTHTHTRSETMTIFAWPKTNDVAPRLMHSLAVCVLIVKLKCSAINCKMAKKCTIRIRIFVSWVQFNYSSISHRQQQWQRQQAVPVAATGRVSVHLEHTATICLWNRRGL